MPQHVHLNVCRWQLEQNRKWSASSGFSKSFLKHAALAHSYRIASADRVLAALHAGYKLPTAPNSTATPNPSSTSSGVMVTEIEADEAEPRDMPVEETVLFPA